MAVSPGLELDPGFVDEIAARLTDAIVPRVVEALRREGITQQATQPTAWLNAQEMARRLGVSREWVYEHASELGATRLGTGPRPRLRFPARGLSNPAIGPRPEPQEPESEHRRARGLIPIYDG